MEIENQIQEYISSLEQPKRNEIEELHKLILTISPECRLWFENGKNKENKIVSNPNIGYGFYTIKYADGKTRNFYRIGLSPNKNGISVYILGIDDKTYLTNTFGTEIGKASVTGYCIKFKTIRDININILKKAILSGFEYINQ